MLKPTDNEGEHDDENEDDDEDSNGHGINRSVKIGIPFHRITIRGLPVAYFWKVTRVCYVSGMMTHTYPVVFWSMNFIYKFNTSDRDTKLGPTHLPDRDMLTRRQQF